MDFVQYGLCRSWSFIRHDCQLLQARLSWAQSEVVPLGILWWASKKQKDLSAQVGPCGTPVVQNSDVEEKDIVRMTTKSI